MMKKAYVATGHHLTKKLAEYGIVFPTSKEEIIDKLDGVMLQVDFDHSISVNEYCSQIPIEYFDNKDEFFCALNSSKISF